VAVHFNQKSLKIPKGNHNPYIEEEQKTQWPKEKVQKDKQRSTRHTYKTKERVTRTPGLSSDIKRSNVIPIRIKHQPTNQPIRIEMIHKRHKSCDILTLVTLFSLYLFRSIARV
jgi:hypothetical protein